MKEHEKIFERVAGSLEQFINLPFTDETAERIRGALLHELFALEAEGTIRTAKTPSVECGVGLDGTLLVSFDGKTLAEWLRFIDLPKTVEFFGTSYTLIEARDSVEFRIGIEGIECGVAFVSEEPGHADYWFAFVGDWQSDKRCNSIEEGIRDLEYKLLRFAVTITQLSDEKG